MSAHLRRRDLAGILNLLKKPAMKLSARVRPKTPLGEAFGYLLAQWTSLTADFEDSQTRLDTNSVENDIQPTKLGDKD